MILLVRIILSLIFGEMGSSWGKLGIPLGNRELQCTRDSFGNGKPQGRIGGSLDKWGVPGKKGLFWEMGSSRK